ncbi:hypothetical protein Pst134EA_011263 [Puccinia striiformis f. sp. tritici]|uniref:hypothetical protein n=1 Tax=Puccinia striiformis f. sp. tritici TaxID=168172 RepID=UPI0020081EE7|nr:hypothetical protein Pst134EA_011263 [Puccinia striiformis f. sp. tritici]KAH9467625.1 hypothetical protein Pst134EA_011263 [Puccinia striiformis f. sp. tritici]
MPFVSKNNLASKAPSDQAQQSTSSSSATIRTPSSILPANGIQNQPKALSRPGNSNNIIVNKRQQGNPVLTLIKSVPWEFGETISDYQLNQTTGSLFLSLKYHRLHPDYLDTRLKELNKAYDLKILLCLCDSDDHELVLKDITKTCMINEFTLMVGWSNSEIARYIQLFKSFEKRPPDLIKEKIDDDYISKLTSVLTTVRGLNKTDVLTLATNFRSFRQIVEASPSELALCPGLGEKKVKRLLEAFNSDFRNFPKDNESIEN